MPQTPHPERIENMRQKSASEKLTGELQAARVMALQTAFRKAEATQGREDAPTAGQIRNLGLIDKEEDTKKVLGK